ncbi:MAG: F0F1 ATP synthase subunit delta [Rothia mucilaginosa]|uniref:F0F1 ATP synthase subunit delta n=1 Tax=Rothia TaxID=32207 RepID=UPI00066C82C7|nr:MULTISPECIES: F0F1 ATP synthase subunit delta [Rothia]MBF1675799.1 F0F1 ATP synthase subunit delta [Rothia sp. (in: high G+C Gram-positive bacteria)]MDU6366563.1 F0F1 ATP synthase subunit delta [Rothia mucilaginosa]OFQ31011.1 ATP synthase subunit delta [Rothia sp. HMSC072E10]OHP74967.1 ATP synthase subunit delta [Rothia sp. HMSC062F03]
MAGVSTESLSKVEEVLEAHASLQPLKLAGELFALVDVLDHNGTLRRAVTDSSRDAAARQGIVNSVFDGKISSQAMAVLTNAVAQRWSEDSDLSDALERAAVLAVIASAQSRGGVDALDEVLNELLTFVRTVDSNAQAQEALSDHQASKEAKKKLAVALGGPATTAEGVLLLERVGSNPRGLHAARAADEFAEIIVKRQNRYIARVTSAINLSQAQLERLGRALNAVYGRELKLDVSVDPAVLGGLRVQVGDEVIDGTVETRMSDLSRSIG